MYGSVAAAGGQFHNLGTILFKSSLQASWVKCRHMPVFHLRHGTARTVRAESRLVLGDHSDSQAAHLARVRGIKRESSSYLVLRNKKAPLLVA